MRRPILTLSGHFLSGWRCALWPRRWEIGSEVPSIDAAFLYEGLEEPLT
jgi:hypothetical protein